MSIKDFSEDDREKKDGGAPEISQASLAEALRIVHIGSWDWDLVTDEMVWSDEVYRILGLNSEECEATHDMYLKSVHPEDREFVEESVSDAVQKRISYNIDYRIVLPEGEERFVNEQAKVFSDDNSKAVRIIGTLQDMTKHKVMEEKVDQSLKEALKSREIMISMLEDHNEIREKLEKKLSELEHAQGMLVQSEKLASLGRLVSDMAHEVNNPLMIINGRAQLALMDDLKDEKLKENFHIIVDQCQRAKEIIQRLLVFSRPSKGEITEVNINETLDLVAKLIEHQYALKDIKMARNYCSSLPNVKVDEKQIHEVFMNLLKNSAEAMTNGGTITVSSAREDNYVRLELQDTGSGISEENLKNIFDPFFTTKETGTGLGLSVCYGIIQAHGGDIKYESEQGKGTTAIIHLPIEEAKNNE